MVKNKKMFFVRPSIIILAVLIFIATGSYWKSDWYQERQTREKRIENYREFKKNKELLVGTWLQEGGEWKMDVYKKW